MYKNFPDTWLFTRPLTRGSEHPFWQGIKIKSLTMDNPRHGFFYSLKHLIKNTDLNTELFTYLLAFLLY